MWLGTENRRAVRSLPPYANSEARFVRLSSFGQYKFCEQRECPQCESCTAAKKGFVKGRLGPFMLVGARSFGRIAAMRLTAARSPKQTLARRIAVASKRRFALAAVIQSLILLCDQTVQFCTTPQFRSRLSEGSVTVEQNSKKSPKKGRQVTNRRKFKGTFAREVASISVI